MRPSSQEPGPAHPKLHAAPTLLSRLLGGFMLLFSPICSVTNSLILNETFANPTP